MLADMPVTYTAAVREKLEAEVERLQPDEDKMKKIICANEHPRAVARFLADVEKVARLPAPGSAKVAMELLVSIAWKSVPEWENVADFAEERAPFDEAVDELYVALAEKRREEEGGGFDIGSALEEIGELAGVLEEFEIPSCFKRSIELLKIWADNDTNNEAKIQTHK